MNVLKADVHPRATDHIKEILVFISELMDKGYAYKTPTGIYFEISKFQEYGKLSGRTISELKPGARIDVDITKNSPLDFALWKFVEEGPSWDSPWGKGRPGWHIECSVMSMKYLGESFEIHGGGQDLVFPHHENEIAQSEAKTGKRFASIWMHVGLLNISENKMSKSIGNIIPVHEALNRWGTNVVRFYSVSSRYRSPMNYSEKAMSNASENWNLIDSALLEIQSASRYDESIVEETKRLVEEEFRTLEEALDEDFNTPIALGALMRVVKFINRTGSTGHLSRQAVEIIKNPFMKALWIFGFRIQEISEEERAGIDKLVSIRGKLRKEGKFKEADEVRERLKGEGIELIDNPDRTLWRKSLKKL